MRITKRQLRKIIKEAALLLESENYVYRAEDGQLRMSDDNGNDEPAPHLESQYGHLERGEGETRMRPRSRSWSRSRRRRM